MGLHEEHGVGPEYEFVKTVRVACPKCKCRTEQGAADKCKATAGYDGEFTCPGDELHTDEQGRFVRDIWRAKK